jgi:AcrR family transcriptional regulator
MNESVNPQRRAYRSAVRAEQANSTRQRVLDTARELFVDRGYASTTIAAVAGGAGTSQETIYATFGGKRGLLEGVIDAVIPLPPEQDAALKAIGRLPSARARLRAFVAFCCGVLAQTSPVHKVIRGAADSEAFAVELRARLLSERLANQKRHFAQHVALDLPARLTPRQAAERFCALTSPELYHLTIAELGWSRRRHEEWISELAERELIDGDA